MTSPCLCYTCIVFTYKGCPFSCTQAWSCGKGCIMGPMIGMTYKDDEMTLSWMGCPKTTYKRVAPPAGAPQNAEMGR